MRSRMKILRNPSHPRTSVISGRGGVPGKGIELIDLGAEPIDRYGVVLITTVEAAQIAKLIGYVDGETVTKKYDEMEAELRELRAKVDLAPAAASDFSERLHNELNDLVGNLIADYRAAVGCADIPDAPARPEWAEGTGEAVHLDGSGRAGNLQIIDGGPLDNSGETIGGPALADGSADSGDPGEPSESDSSGDGSDRHGTGAGGADDATSNPVSGDDGEGDSASSSILGIYVGDDE